jgi:intraflagellar transport protein 80
MRSEYITKDMVSLSPDTLAVVDSTDNKAIQIIDATTGRNVSKITHSAEVTRVQLNQHCLGTQERHLVYSDRNRDLHVAALFGSNGASGTAIPTYKLLANVESFAYNDETNVLVCLADGRMKLWYQPEVVFVDRDLLPVVTVSSEATEEYGRSAIILNYTGSRISVRKVDGSILFTYSSPDIALLYELANAGKWDEAVRLCRHQKSPCLWGTLASMSLSKKQLDTTEQALAEVCECVDVWMCGCVDLWMCGCVDVWMCGCVDV